MLNFLGRKWNHWIHGNIRENRKLKNINHLLHIRIKMKISPTSLENWNFRQITARCIWHSITNKSMFFSNLCKRRYLTFLYIKIFKSHLIFYTFYLHNQKKKYVRTSLPSRWLVGDYSFRFSTCIQAEV